jgi:hypothetical protein
MITVPGAAPVDPPVTFRPVIAEITALGGEGLVNICAPDACGQEGMTAQTEGVAEAASMVAPAPEPAGKGQPDDPASRLRRWVEYVGAVATYEAD